MKRNEICFHVGYAKKNRIRNDPILVLDTITQPEDSNFLIFGLNEFSKLLLKRLDFNSSLEILLQFISSSANFLLI